MATLLNNVTTDTTGIGASHTGPCTVFVRGVFDGATVKIEVSDDDTTYIDADNTSFVNTTIISSDSCVNINCLGTYYVRCVLADAGAETNVSAVSTQ